MAFQSPPTNFRVDHSYENEFALAASAEVVGIVAFALMLTSIMPNLPWAIVATTTGPVSSPTNSSRFYPITNEPFTLWSNSCYTPGMEYTYNFNMCNTRYQVVAAFAVLGTMFALLAVTFGIMPFSPVAPREPKLALTHAMLSHMISGLFYLISWSVFYGGLVHGVWMAPNTVIVFSGIPWDSDVLVTYGGIVAVTAWCASFCAWVLSLSAMIKYDSAAAEQAVIDHKQKKEERRRRKAELIDRLGEGAARAAREGIALELGDKLYLGGSIAAGATSAIAWMNNGITPYLLESPSSLPVTAGASLIMNVVATTVGAIVLIIGLSDLVPRPKASVGGFAVFAVSTVIFICSFGMGISFLQGANSSILAFEAAVGTIGIGFSLATTIVLYHPFKIWEKVMSELPRPAKIHKGKNGVALTNTAAVGCLFGLGLACASVTIYVLNGSEFAGLPQTPAPTAFPTNSTGPACPNKQGDLCFIGPPANRCCPPPLICTEVAYTKFTCEEQSTKVLAGQRDSYAVAQAFLGLFIGTSTLAFVFASIAVAPNGVMDVEVALSVTFSMAFVGSACGIITFAVLQGYILSVGQAGMPIECGYLLGGFVAELIGATCAFFAWLPYHSAPVPTQEDQHWEAERELEIERVRLQTAKTVIERLELQEQISSLQARAAELHKNEEEEKTSDTQVMTTATDLQAT